jgi:O-antigen/teichoic acid export membrane protein
LRINELTQVSVANFFGTAVISIFWILIASILEPEEYGEISYFLAIANIISVVAFLGAGQTLVVFVAKGVNLQSEIFFVSLLSSIIVSTAAYFVLGSIEVSIYVIGYVIFGLVTHELLGLKYFKKYSLYLITQKILMVVLAIIFYFILGITGIILGYALSFLPYSFIIYKLFKKSKIELKSLKPKLGFILNNYGRDLAKISSRHIDKLVIFPVFGATVLGNYQLGFQVLMMLVIVPSIVYQYVLPLDSSGQNSKKLKKNTIIISSILSTVVIIITPFIVPVLFPKFTEAVLIIQILSLAIIPISISLMFNSKMLAAEMSKHVIVGSVIFLAIQISGISILGNIYGVIGIAASTLIGAIGESIYLMFINKQKM